MNLSTIGRTSGFFDETNNRSTRTANNNTSNSYSDLKPYATVLPSNMDVFSNLSAKMSALENASVFEQVKQVLQHLYLSLQKANEDKPMSNYLSRINLVQQDDKSALLEWNFQDFRAGFALEPIPSESRFFIVSQDKSIGSFTTEIQRLDLNNLSSIDTLVGYVLENT